MPFGQPKLEPTPTGVDLQGKTAIVTGASAGIGEETCRQLLQLRVSNLYMAVRNVAKGEGVRDALLADPSVKMHNPKANVQVLRLDMDDLKSVHAFNSTVKAQVPALDIMVLNAGMGNVKYETSPTGHERVFQVNVLSNALLVYELLPLMIATADRTGVPGHLTWVGSRMHRRATFEKRPIPTDTKVTAWIDDPANFTKFDQYSDTKFLALLFFNAVAERVPRDKVVCNTMCPGMVYTDMANHLPWIIRTLTHMVWSVRARSPQEAGWVVVNAAAVAGKESHGEFLADKEILMWALPHPEMPCRVTKC